MILSLKHRFIFFCNSRTGSTSVEAALRPVDEGRPYRFAARGLFNEQHIPPAIVRGLLPTAIWESSFKFAFVRNPYDWFVSQWFHNFPPPDPGARSWWSISLRRARQRLRERRLYPGRRAGDLSARQVFTPDDVSFLHAYLKERFRTLPQRDGKHQSAYLLDADGSQLLDFVGRFETLHEDFTRVMERVGVRAELPHLNRRAHAHYSSYFTEASAAAVYGLWREDFDVLGYPRELDRPG